MSELQDLFIAVSFALVISLFVRTSTQSGKLPKWWLWLALVPLLSLGMTLAILLFPRPIPEGWQEGDFDTGRADLVALIFYGIILPSAYLTVALPAAFLVRLAKARARNQ